MENIDYRRLGSLVFEEMRGDQDRNFRSSSTRFPCEWRDATRSRRNLGPSLARFLGANKRYVEIWTEKCVFLLPSNDVLWDTADRATWGHVSINGKGSSWRFLTRMLCLRAHNLIKYCMVVPCLILHRSWHWLYTWLRMMTRHDKEALNMDHVFHQVEPHGRSWKAMEGRGRSWKVMEVGRKFGLSDQAWPGGVSKLWETTHSGLY